MIEVFIHEEYVNKRREQKKKQQQQQPQRRRRPHMRGLQIEIDKLKLPPAIAALGQQMRPRDQNQQQADVPRSPVGSPTAADTATFRDHLFDYLKPY